MADETNETPLIEPYVPDDTPLADFRVPPILLGILAGAVLGSANAYIGLRVGLTISTSIPLAVIMVVLLAALRPIYGRASVLDVNLGQTAGSASSSLASGVIFTIPALFMWGLVTELGTGIVQVAFLAACGGLLGILFMIPLRPFLIVKEHHALPYPEGTASSKVLIAADAGGTRARNVILGLLVGMVHKLGAGVGKLWPEEISMRLPVMPKAELVMEPMPALLGVGYILGYRVGAIMVAGGLISWLVLIPSIAHFGAGFSEPLFPETVKPIAQMSPSEIWSRYIRYIGAGAVAMAGLLAVARSLPIMFDSLRAGLRGLMAKIEVAPRRTQRDLSMLGVLAGTGLVIAVLALNPVGIGQGAPFLLRLVAAVAVAVFAFRFVTVSSRIVGLVGVTSNPTSGMAIVTLLGSSLLFYALGWTDDFGKATVLTIGTVVCVAASIAGDISQDLKTGFLIGATPRSQQIAEITAALANAMTIAAVVFLLGISYGFGNEEFPAPQATLARTVIEGVLNADLPWGLVGIGAFLSVTAQLLGVPPLAFAVGVYLPLSTMTPVFLGGCLRWGLDTWNGRYEDAHERQEQGILFGSGLIAGEGLTGVGIAALAVGLGARPPGFGLSLPEPFDALAALGLFVVMAGLLVRLSRPIERRTGADVLRS
ncbi:MAG: oligopeptide transporter, OPT family [Acidobacteriota bacterium]|nr:MAG: oligopeptide transporter, OPT family [Acidobacteriota bacterium]